MTPRPPTRPARRATAPSIRLKRPSARTSPAPGSAPRTKVRPSRLCVVSLPRVGQARATCIRPASERQRLSARPAPSVACTVDWIPCARFHLVNCWGSLAVNLITCTPLRVTPECAFSARQRALAHFSAPFAFDTKPRGRYDLRRPPSRSRTIGDPQFSACRRTAARDALACAADEAAYPPTTRMEVLLCLVARTRTSAPAF